MKYQVINTDNFVCRHVPQRFVKDNVKPHNLLLFLYTPTHATSSLHRLTDKNLVTNFYNIENSKLELKFKNKKNITSQLGFV